MQTRRAAPFAYLAVLAFLAGFIAYMAACAPVAATVETWVASLAPAEMTGPVSAEWRMERRI
ncbi:MAG: hypothetical protein ABW042_01600 [Phenylobacterium sp.]